MIEEAEFRVRVSITFDTTVFFAPLERNGAITKADALDNFYGMGLNDLFDSGEYVASITAVEVNEV